MKDVPAARQVDNPVPFCRFTAFPPHSGRIFRDRPRRVARRESNPTASAIYVHSVYLNRMHIFLLDPSMPLQLLISLYRFKCANTAEMQTIILIHEASFPVKCRNQYNVRAFRDRNKEL